MSDLRLIPVDSPDDLEAVRRLCWAYRDFLLQNSEIDRQITEAFYPTAAYTALMADLARYHARPQGMILLARGADGTPFGCGMTHALDPKTAEIKRVYVTPEARGLGVARKLCTTLMDQARTDGYGRIVLDTSRSLIAAGPLYEALGFTEIGPYQPIPPQVVPHLRFFEYALI